VPGFVEERAGERLQHRQRDEQRHQRAAEHHAAGDEDIAAKPPEPRDAGAEQHQQRDQHQRAAEADARLALGDREAAGQQPDRAERAAEREPAALAASRRQQAPDAGAQQPERRHRQPAAAVAQPLHHTARGIRAAEDDGQRFEHALVGEEVPGQQRERDRAQQQPATDRVLRAIQGAGLVRHVGGYLG
jgi:hypothetical protein